MNDELANVQTGIQISDSGEMPKKAHTHTLGMYLQYMHLRQFHVNLLHLVVHHNSNAILKCV